MRLGAWVLSGTLLLAPLGVQASETLADIRQDMSVLFVELQKLKRELSTTGPSTVALPAGALDRINAIEAELQRLTAKTEELDFRVGQVAEDGARRLGDLEFRLCELEADCDLGSLGRVPTLGGEAETSAPVAQPVPQTPGTELAVGEETDFRRAGEALAQGDFQSAADQFATFRQTYPGGPLEAQALVAEGRALEGLGNLRDAARRYLDAYAGYPDDAAGPEALWRLGAALGDLGNVAEACVTLSEVAGRYPGSTAIAEAEAQKARFGCQ
ncbi:tetratricopeptide repeat protein [Marivita hallyeonensis]|uniref:Cell division coordinator CpoB n=1 Tax=Marivita hallyeonensis TaxID=996342 RepID=A0A1M5ND51_9RHOB|nr:tetratricopeptide repeat protein [Marivita hallyeonensis]SHG87438.1 tol-pal system protein YbgF [Marivita hallyeonensis]